jgi:hypothetical protein
MLKPRIVNIGFCNRSGMTKYGKIVSGKSYLVAIKGGMI